MTTTSTVERPGVARLRKDGPAPRTASSHAVEAMRAESHAALTQLVSMLGYPPHWADELERRAYAAGRVWSSAAPGDEGPEA